MISLREQNTCRFGHFGPFCFHALLGPCILKLRWLEASNAILVALGGARRSKAERWDRQPEKWSLQWMTEFSKELDALDLCNCEEVKRCFLPMFDLGHRALLFPPKPRKPPNFLPGCPGSAGSEQVLRKGQWHAPHQRDFDLNRLEESWQKYTFFATNTAQEGTGS